MRKAELFTYGMCMLAVSVWRASARGQLGGRDLPVKRCFVWLLHGSCVLEIL